MQTIHIQSFDSLSAIRRQRKEEGLMPSAAPQYLLAFVSNADLNAMLALPGFIPAQDVGTWDESIPAELRPQVIGLCEGMAFVAAN